MDARTGEEVQEIREADGNLIEANVEAGLGVASWVVGPDTVGIWTPGKGASLIELSSHYNDQDFLLSPDSRKALYRLRAGPISDSSDTLVVRGVVSGEESILNIGSGSYHGNVWSPDSTLFALADQDSIMFMDLATKANRLLDFENVILLEWISEGEQLFTLSENGDMIIWEFP